MCFRLGKATDGSVIGGGVEDCRRAPGNRIDRDEKKEGEREEMLMEKMKLR